jgi:hypothetical protein
MERNSLVAPIKEGLKQYKLALDLAYKAFMGDINRKLPSEYLLPHWNSFAHLFLHPQCSWTVIPVSPVNSRHTAWTITLPTAITCNIWMSAAVHRKRQFSIIMLEPLHGTTRTVPVYLESILVGDQKDAATGGGLAIFARFCASNI